VGEHRTYTQEQRAEALALYVSDGLGAASRTLNIPQGTIASWAHRTPGIQTLAAEKREQTAAMLEERALHWQARRADLAEQFGAIADTMLAAAFDYSEAGRPRDVKDSVMAAAIAVDKAQLLTGGATSRTDHEISVGARQELLAEGRARVMELMPPTHAARTGTDG
jgi:transposase-like protein